MVAGVAAFWLFMIVGGFWSAPKKVSLGGNPFRPGHRTACVIGTQQQLTVTGGDGT